MKQLLIDLVFRLNYFISTVKEENEQGDKKQNKSPENE
jgi:hypothetical protein